MPIAAIGTAQASYAAPAGLTCGNAWTTLSRQDLAAGTRRRPSASTMRSLTTMRASIALPAALVPLAAAALIAGSLNAASPPHATTSGGDVQRGFQLALKVCEECHIVADGRRRPKPPAPGAPSFFELAKLPRVTAFYLRAWFRTPHRNMPDLILPRAERDDVIAYILSLKPKQ
jgi:mono/diheme cytochrome c family protein